MEACRTDKWKKVNEKPFSKATPATFSHHTWRYFPHSRPGRSKAGLKHFPRRGLGPKPALQLPGPPDLGETDATLCDSVSSSGKWRCRQDSLRKHTYRAKNSSWPNTGTK